ncbi:4Fe-4S binding protein [Alistipes shahii]|uniref:4Fe-4S binding protein n=1 Tax=Alistipes shahii TaxID=328814 RepID=UPI003AF6864A
MAFLVILTLLFGRVYCSVICPLGGDAGHRFVGLREAQKAPEPLRVLPRPHLAAPGDARRVRRRDAGGCRFAARALQRLRPHRLEPAGPGLRVGQQPAGIHRRAHGQLRLLFGRRLDEEPFHAACRRRDVRRAVCSCVAQRPHLL